MGHHHRKNRPAAESTASAGASTAENSNTNPSGNMDFASMLGNLNMDNFDLSKVDFNKVQSMMQKIKLPDNIGSGANSTNGADPRLAFLNSLKGVLPPGRSKTMDNVTKFIQLTSLISSKKS
jgi:hypothetical protein